MSRPILLDFIDKLLERLRDPAGPIQVVLGPRQVGKTTTILQMIEDFFPESSLYVTTEDAFNPDGDWLRTHWFEAQRTNRTLFVDEIQKIYNWAESIKSLYDQAKRQKKNIRCVLLGSSSLEIQKGLSESLTGRFQLLRAYHWNYRESKEGYGLSFEDYLKFGGYPGSYKMIHSGDWIDFVANSIVGTVVEKDILQYQTVKSPALFRQAFDIIVSYPAQEISYTKLLGQLQDRGNVEIIKYYLKLYEGAYLIKVLDKFSEKTVLKKSSSPKILPLAPCLPYLHIRAPYTPDERGRIFEAIVGAQLVRTGEALYYWREGKHEVDFVVKRGREIWAVEVKSGKSKARSGLDRFQEKFKRAKAVFVTEDNYMAFEEDPMRFLETNFISV